MKTAKIIGFVLIIFLVNCTLNSETVTYEEVEELKLEALTQEEVDDLLFLREEEKLARDVYLYSFEKYNKQIFEKISNSEIQHMGSVLKLLEKYNLTDPASDVVGVFNNPYLQKVYNDLIAQSSISLLEALLVGDKIEDLDIKDLTLNEERTEKSDLLSVYGSLKCGSRNHLRSFNNQVLQNDGIYIPEYITQEEFDSIVTSPKENCG